MKKYVLLAFFGAFIALSFFSCKPINGPEGGQGETSGDTINKPEDPKDLLMGEWYCVNNSNRCIYSENDNFAVVDRILEDNPNAFEIPKTQLSWGGKTFIPE